jgi:molybdopterin converting factor small subunit
MRVTIEFFGPAREAAGGGRQVIELSAPCPAAELVTRIAHERGGRLATLLLSNGRLSRSVMLAVNNEQADATALEEGDVVAIIPPVSGGAV